MNRAHSNSQQPEKLEANIEAAAGCLIDIEHRPLILYTLCASSSVEQYLKPRRIPGSPESEILKSPKDGVR
jgi:hypothetical protein